MIRRPFPAAAAIVLVGVTVLPAWAERRIVDGTGEAVVVPDAPRRIVSLGPDLTETLFDLGLGERVVGVSDSCDRPAAVRDRPRVGPLVQPSVEAILTLQPDLVVATSQGNPRAVLDRLRELGVAVFGVRPSAGGLAGVAEQVRTLAAVTGVPERGTELAGEFERRLRALATHHADVARLDGCLLVWTSPPVASGTGTFLHDLMALVALENSCAFGRDEYPRLSREDLLLAAPDVLILAVGSDHGPELGAWADVIPAVRDGKVLHVDPDRYLRPTVGLAAAGADLAERLQPLRASSGP